MSQFNPYEPMQSRQISINPIDLYKRSLALMGDQYWLFVAMTFLAILIGSVVPFGILMGPMFVGLYLCFKEREEGRRVEFGKLFQGFDEFVNSLVVTLILIAVSLVVIIPCYIIGGIGMFAILGPGQGNGPPQVNPAALLGFLFGLVLLVSLASLAIYVPFVFAYQLVADRKMGGGLFHELQSFAQEFSWRTALYHFYNHRLHACRDSVLPSCVFGDADQFRGLMDSLPRRVWLNGSRVTVTLGNWSIGMSQEARLHVQAQVIEVSKIDPLPC